MQIQPHPVAAKPRPAYVGGAVGYDFASDPTKAVTQGVAVATGLQDQFSWTGVAASGMGAGVGQMVGQGLQGTAFQDAFGRYGVAAVAGFAGGAAAALALGGRMNATQVAVDAFGNVIGNSIVEQEWTGNGQPTPVLDAAQMEGNPYDLAYGIPAGTGLRLGGGVGLSVSDNTYAEWVNRTDASIAQAASNLDDRWDAGKSIQMLLERQGIASSNEPYGADDSDFGMMLTGGGNARGPVRSGQPIEMAKNIRGEAVGQLVADPWGLLGPGLTGEYNGIGAASQRYSIKLEIDEISVRLGQSGRNVPEVSKAWVHGGLLADDYSPAQLDRFRTIENLEVLRKQGIVELEVNWGIKSVASGREMFVNPRQVRFTQEWVSYNSSDKINTLDTTGRTVQSSPERMPAMDIVLMPDGRLTSLDNRRLAASYLYDAENVKVIIRAGSDPLPDTRTVERFSWNGYAPNTWAEAAAIRIFKQGPDFRGTFRQGSPVVPMVRNAPTDPFYQPYLTSPTRRR